MPRGRLPKIKKLRETIAEVRRNMAAKKQIAGNTPNMGPKKPTSNSTQQARWASRLLSEKLTMPSLPENVIEVQVPRMPIPVRIQKPVLGQERRVSYQGNTVVVSNINGEIVTRVEKLVEEKKGQ